MKKMIKKMCVWANDNETAAGVLAVKCVLWCMNVVSGGRVYRTLDELDAEDYARNQRVARVLREAK